MFNFKKERLVKDSIGHGSFGEVFPYQKNPEDFKWVVKRTKAKKIEDLLRCLPEIVLGFSCDHPCIVPVKGYSIESKDNKYNIYMKLPRMSGGTLADELRRRSKKDQYFSETELVKHFYALVSGVDYLHSKGISHGDIKINNILLDDKGNLKLCDIGSGKFVADDDHYNTMTSANGAINYKAPEIIQHERALKDYNLKSKSEKKDQPMENILKREHLYLADSWSLGLTMLEICTLKSGLINPYDSVQFIKERFEKIRKEARTRYQDTLLEIIFGLLETDPAQRLKVSAAKARLEENFKHILTDDFRASLGLPKQSKEDAPNMSNYLEVFNERANKILQTFEDDKKAKENRLNLFEESIEKLQERLKGFHLEIERINLKKKQEMEEVSKKYEDSILTMKTELEGLRKELDQSLQMKKKQVAQKKPRDEEAYRKKLEKVSAELTRKWSEWFNIKLDPSLFIQIKEEKVPNFDDKVLKDVTEDIICECCEEDLWDEIDKLSLGLGSWNIKNEKMTDEGLKAFATQLIPRLSNLKFLGLGMTNWNQISYKGLEILALQLALHLTHAEDLGLKLAGWSQISDQGLKILTSQLDPILVNLKQFQLEIYGWDITDDGFKTFASQSLSKLVNAHHLTLGIGGSSKITGESLETLASQFGSNLANIKTFFLYLAELESITSKSLHVLANSISQSLPNIQELTLFFYECPSVTKATIENLKLRLKKIPKLSIIKDPEE